VCVRGVQAGCRWAWLRDEPRTRLDVMGPCLSVALRVSRQSVRVVGDRGWRFLLIAAAMLLLVQMAVEARPVW